MTPPGGSSDETTVRSAATAGLPNEVFVTFRLTSITPGEDVFSGFVETGAMVTTLANVPFPPVQESSLTMFFECGLNESQSCFPTNEPQFYPDPTKPVGQGCPTVAPPNGICARVPGIDIFESLPFLRQTTYTPSPTGPTTVPLRVRFKDMSGFGAPSDHFESAITLNLDLLTRVVTPVVPTGDGFLNNIVSNGAPNHFCAIFETGSSPGNICFAVDVVSATTSPGTMDYDLRYVFYIPPGAQSVQNFGTNYTVSSSSSWQIVDKNGTAQATQVGISVGPNIEGGVSIPASLTFSFGGQQTDVVESISGGGTSSSRTDGTTINIASHSDYPSPIFDEFFLAYNIPAGITNFSDNRKPVINLDYQSSKTVTLNGAELLAMAQSAANVDQVLSLTVTDPAAIQEIKTFITPADARAVLLLDPNFVATTPGGPIVARNSSQLNQFIQANTDRFQPVPVNVGGLPVPQTQFGNTMPVPAAPAPFSPFPTTSFTQSISNSTASSTSTGNGTDFQLQDSWSVSIPGLFTTGTGI